MGVFAAAVERGIIEPVCHGYLHLDSEALTRGVVEPREYARAAYPEAAEKVDATLEWLERTLGRRPQTFVAPTWGYGPGLQQALDERSLVSWRPPRPGPVLDGLQLHETLFSTLEGLHRLDYRPLAGLAAAGVPPTVVLHGGLLDQRMVRLRRDRDLASAARLAIRRDLSRLPALDGIRWVGVSELLECLRAHDRIEVQASEVVGMEGSESVIVRRPGRLVLED
jgi:hypothetical protein